MIAVLPLAATSPISRAPGAYPPGAVDLHALATQLLEHFTEVAEGGVGGGDSAMDRLLQQHLFYFIEWKAAFARGPHVHAKILPSPQRHRGAHHQDAARAVIEARPRPHLVPAVGDDQVLQVLGVGLCVGNAAVHTGFAQEFAP
jgi:hypothetical protein